jgi:putative membrane protein
MNDTYYHGFLAFHVFSFISWFAVLFYLPRLFVYHAENSDKKEFVEVVKIMEYKLLVYIGTPAMWATVFSGVYLGYLADYFSEFNWLSLKMIGVSTLVCFHIYLSRLRVRLEKDECKKSGKFFRVLNEFPTLLMIFIVIMVVFKPAI